MVPSGRGGDFALLTRCVLAAARDEPTTLRSVLGQARVENNIEVQVHALDALARLDTAVGDLAAGTALLAEADRLAPQVAHLLDESDRLDAAAARHLITGRALCRLIPARRNGHTTIDLEHESGLGVRPGQTL